jgi:hypothetical protein
MKALGLVLAWCALFWSKTAAADDPPPEGEPSPSDPQAIAPPPPSTPPAEPPTAKKKPDESNVDPDPSEDAPRTTKTKKLEVTPIGYVELYYAYNLNNPANQITNYRGFDNRHNTFSLSNAALGAQGDYGDVSTRIILQIGSTGATYYLSEPNRAGTSAANTTDPNLWRYLQEATVTYHAPIGRGLRIQAGLRPSPIGFEAFAVKDHWTWSRSNLFFGLPFYHVGVRFKYDWNDNWASTVAVYNGWNGIVDNNEEKSIETHTTYHVAEKLMIRGLYFGGVERPTGSAEGPYWRHHFNAVVQWQIADWLASAAQADYGFEPNRFGTARWWAAAAAVRVRVLPILKGLYFVYRGDRFHEHLATRSSRPGQSSSPLFWGGAEWVTSGTSTLDFRPHDNISIRLEHRLDVAEAPLYFRGDNIQGDGSSANPFIPNTRYQETILLGTTAWF